MYALFTYSPENYNHYIKTIYIYISPAVFFGLWLNYIYSEYVSLFMCISFHGLDEIHIYKYTIPL